LRAGSINSTDDLFRADVKFLIRQTSHSSNGNSTGYVLYLLNKRVLNKHLNVLHTYNTARQKCDISYAE
jgi:hypothetical protein